MADFFIALVISYGGPELWKFGRRCYYFVNRDDPVTKERKCYGSSKELNRQQVLKYIEEHKNDIEEIVNSDSFHKEIKEAKTTALREYELARKEFERIQKSFTTTKRGKPKDRKFQISIGGKGNKQF
jgi:hypothetical protein